MAKVDSKIVNIDSTGGIGDGVACFYDSDASNDNGGVEEKSPSFAEVQLLLNNARITTELSRVVKQC